MGRPVRQRWRRRDETPTGGEDEPPKELRRGSVLGAYAAPQARAVTVGQLKHSCIWGIAADQAATPTALGLVICTPPGQAIIARRLPGGACEAAAARPTPALQISKRDQARMEQARGRRHHRSGGSFDCHLDRSCVVKALADFIFPGGHGKTLRIEREAAASQRSGHCTPVAAGRSRDRWSARRAQDCIGRTRRRKGGEYAKGDSDAYIMNHDVEIMMFVVLLFKMPKGRAGH
eukprot:scaffold2651_cov118-Isochrysis_galbana.AAC.10